ncbi:MAG: hypothetical protein KAH21_07165, partial [Spirochaetaceae bacterium]|nr:hypothetical protein [Spirochaetaceae bacterium]
MKIEPDQLTAFEGSRPGAPGYRFPDADIPPGKASIPDTLRRKTPAALPELSEIETVRHFTKLSGRNFG